MTSPMDNDLLQDLFRRLPLPFALHEMIYLPDGRPHDYRFIWVNQAFLDALGLKESPEGKTLREAFPEVLKDSFDWVAFFSSAAAGYGVRKALVFSENLKRPFNVISFSPRPGTFAAIFQDVSDELNRIRLLEESGERIKAISLEFETVFEGIQEGAFLVEVSEEGFKYLMVNQNYRVITGIGDLDVRGLKASQFLGEAASHEIEENYRLCISRKETLNFKEKLVTGEGIRVLSTVLIPVANGEGAPHILGFIKDVTEQERAQEERDEALSRYRAMFNDHSAVMLLIEPKSGRIVDANPAAANFYGYSVDELRSMKVQDINILPQEEVERRRLKALSGRQRYFLFPHRLRSGEVRMVDVYSAPVDVMREKLLFSIIFDVTDRERIRKQLEEEKELFKTTLMSIGDGVVTTDQSGIITSANPEACRLSNRSQGSLLDANFSDAFPLLDPKTGDVRDPLGAALKTGRTLHISELLLRVPGNELHVSGSASPIKDQLGEVMGGVVVLRDITHEKKWRDRMLFMSYHDSLTRLPNRRFLEEQMAQLEEEQSFPVAVMMADVNGLKMTNDAFGHERGDALLVAAARLLKGACRRGDVVGRWGGDEFVLLLPGATPDGARIAAERIAEAASKARLGDLEISIALGWGAKVDPSQRLHQALKEAEEMMYRHKLTEGREQRRRILDQILASLGARSHEDEGHRNRLRRLCINIGSTGGLNWEALEDLERLCLYHDLGMIAVPARTLLKPGGLGEPEWLDVRRHTEVGYRIAQNIPELAGVADLILLHHERHDGSGYPRGLKGLQIPVQCRIFALADSYDAMTQPRPYRTSVSPREALKEIESQRGLLFDPDLTDLFIRVVSQEI
ncbi:PAS domain S-box/diguanylate cyclase (GGDEF) domain-containing protein [Thermanaerovibrio velox DSM 12556]|uniref:PAS domain S-box/diguanylate cyclase (GGDEF) domain-containing protein n=1 Tax=Thermanaerovibrio velox DSM 12556 TaxID=926567 RepID=H0UQQ6_9BACT|nr:PAS domain-containing protein [Thermanaerovibrio velox]EHM10820.1 PAS domain S-box/diguanylate cyclase (GGDEF) domain-containing protein [Thermanaerovibrio velox DSM 12556]